MKKEILTKKYIKYDFNHRFIYKMTIMMIILIISILLLIQMLTLHTQVLSFRLFFLCPPVCLVIGVLWHISYLLRMYWAISKEKYTIVIEKVTDMQEHVTAPYNRYFIKNHRFINTPFVLEFESYGRYNIPLGKHYTWSKIYAMWDKGIYRYTDRGDTFYLVIAHNKFILQVYPTKLFEYKTQ